MYPHWQPPDKMAASAIPPPFDPAFAAQCTLPRRGLALRYIEDPNKSITEITFLKSGMILRNF